MQSGKLGAEMDDQAKEHLEHLAALRRGRGQLLEQIRVHLSYSVQAPHSLPMVGFEIADTCCCDSVFG